MPAMSRRSFLRTGTSAAAGAVLFAAAEVPAAATTSTGTDRSGLPVADLESIIGAQGDVAHGVLSIEVDRGDLTTVVNGAGVPIMPAFQVNGDFVFQALDGHTGQAVFNGDFAFLAREIQPAIDAMERHGLTLQALHQHFYDWTPQVWFMHFRGRGNARQLARGVRAVLDVTATPLPQKAPSKPTSPLDASRLGRIIGAQATVGADGVVSMLVPRRESLSLAGDRINPYLNVALPIAFEPLGGSRAAVVPDFGMLASETDRLVVHMRRLGWQVGCLYNQETAETPQLYFSHQFKQGDAYQLANEVRSGLDLLNVDTSM